MILIVVSPYYKTPLANFAYHRHCGSGDRMFLVDEEEDSTFLQPPLLFIPKGREMKAHVIILKTPILVTRA